MALGLFGSQSRPGLVGGPYSSMGSSVISTVNLSDLDPTAVAPATTTSPLYKFGMSPTLWAVALAVGAGGYWLYRKHKKGR